MKEEGIEEKKMCTYMCKHVYIDMVTCIYVRIRKKKSLTHRIHINSRNTQTAENKKKKKTPDAHGH